jgi:hypothetical protein
MKKDFVDEVLLREFEEVCAKRIPSLAEAGKRFLESASADFYADGLTGSLAGQGAAAPHT